MHHPCSVAFSSPVCLRYCEYRYSVNLHERTVTWLWHSVTVESMIQCLCVICAITQWCLNITQQELYSVMLEHYTTGAPHVLQGLKCLYCCGLNMYHICSTFCLTFFFFFLTVWKTMNLVACLFKLKCLKVFWMSKYSTWTEHDVHGKKQWFVTVCFVDTFEHSLYSVIVFQTSVFSQVHNEHQVYLAKVHSSIQ